jgi:hypothetical protein
MWPHFLAEGIQDPTEPGLGVSHDRLQPIDRVIAFGMMQLISAQQRVVDTTNDLRHRVSRIQRLIRVHLTSKIRVTRHLPARQVDGLQTRAHLLHRLITGQCTERIDVRQGRHVTPEFLGAMSRERMLNRNGAAKTHDILGAVTTLHTAPSRARGPFSLQLVGTLKGHVRPHSVRGMIQGLAGFARRSGQLAVGR